jgi:hypothetical protein
VLLRPRNLDAAARLADEPRTERAADEQSLETGNVVMTDDDQIRVELACGRHEHLGRFADARVDEVLDAAGHSLSG